MANYAYVALDAKGVEARGALQVGSLNEACQRLKDMGLFPTKVVEKEDKPKFRPLPREGRKAPRRLTDVLQVQIPGFGCRIKPRALTAFTRQVATLITTGMPLLRGLRLLEEQETQRNFKRVLRDTIEAIEGGSAFSEALAQHPRVFNSLYLNMVRAGEASGTLHLVLERLADFSEKQQALRGRVRAAIAYPFFMFLVGSVVLFFLVTFVVPNVTKIFDEMHQSLPLITIILIGVSRFLETFWWVIVAGLIASFIALKYFLFRTERGRTLRDRILLRLPVIGSMNRRIAVARFSRTLGTLLESGVPLLASLEIVRNIVGNALISDAIHKASIDVREGQSLSAPLARSGLFPAISVEMISVGEQSGNLEPMLYRIADSYEKEVESNITMLTSLLEPVMILVMGLIVGFIVVSILLPIFEMNQLVR